MTSTNIHYSQGKTILVNCLCGASCLVVRINLSAERRIPRGLTSYYLDNWKYPQLPSKDLYKAMGYETVTRFHVEMECGTEYKFDDGNVTLWNDSAGNLRIGSPLDMERDLREQAEDWLTPTRGEAGREFL